MKDATYWITRLNLMSHPEGGFYKETYRSKEIIAKEALPERFSGDRVFSTSIYFLLDNDNFSAFHRIKQDEIWHFYDGSSLTIHVIDMTGIYTALKLGRDIDANENLQVLVEAGCFFAAEVNVISSFSLVGCTVAPGFDFADFEMPSKSELLAKFPVHENVIKRFSI